MKRLNEREIVVLLALEAVGTLKGAGEDLELVLELDGGLESLNIFSKDQREWFLKGL